MLQNPVHGFGRPFKEDSKNSKKDPRDEGRARKAEQDRGRDSSTWRERNRQTSSGIQKGYLDLERESQCAGNLWTNNLRSMVEMAKPHTGPKPLLPRNGEREEAWDPNTPNKVRQPGRSSSNSNLEEGTGQHLDQKATVDDCGREGKTEKEGKAEGGTHQSCYP